MKHWKWTTWLAFIISASGIFLIVFFALNKNFNDGSGKISPNLANNFGGFIGGIVGPIFSLAGFLLLYETIVAQRVTFEGQQFEAKFFELVRYHRDNVSQMVHRIPWGKDKYYEGPRVFIEIKSQFEKLYKKVLPLVKKHHDKREEIKNKNEAIYISYMILFFGVSKTTIKTLEDLLLERKIDESLIKEIIEEVRKEKCLYNSKTVYFGGHQVRLSHYFRHLYQTVKFVDKTKHLSDEEKYNYVKIVRAQMTQYELGVFFLNSISLGDKWKDNGYIIKYDLLKNLPPKFIYDINVAEFYKKENIPSLKKYHFKFLSREITISANHH